LFEQIELLEFSISSKSKKLQLAERRPSLQTKKKKSAQEVLCCAGLRSSSLPHSSFVLLSTFSFGGARLLGFSLSLSRSLF
jgi:hypothetical protein